MNDPQTPATETADERMQPFDMKLEVVVIPVSDVDRAKDFYTRLGWTLNVDVAKDEHFRVVLFTPPGSHCSVLFGNGVTTQEPGSAQGLHVVVSDVSAARETLVKRGIEVSEVFHDVGGLFHHAGTEGRVSGPHPERRSYASFASFSDPDGNGWVCQEVTRRHPGRMSENSTTFTSSYDLASALRRAAVAHGKYEMQIGHHDDNWPDWYADFIVREQHGR
ncbi:MAG: VOC family protein [Candidatus Pacebacteria bacterium]|nr:VOC family protein [Candidatus Paceibacterota bacterium]